MGSVFHDFMMAVRAGRQLPKVHGGACSMTEGLEDRPSRKSLLPHAEYILQSKRQKGSYLKNPAPGKKSTFLDLTRDIDGAEVFSGDDLRYHTGNWEDLFDAQKTRGS